MKAGDKVEYGFFDADRNNRKFQGTVVVAKPNKVVVKSNAGHDVELVPGKDHIRVLNTSFSNGRSKAEAYLNQRAVSIGVQNGPYGTKVEDYKDHAIYSYQGKFLVWTRKGTGWLATSKGSLAEAKQFIDGHKMPQPGSRVSEYGD